MIIMCAFFSLPADVETRRIDDDLRTRTGADSHAGGHNGRVRGRGTRRAPSAPPFGQSPPDVGRGRVDVGRRAPAQQTVVLRHPLQGRVRQDDIRQAGQGVRGLFQPVQRAAAPLPVQVRNRLQ